MGPCPDCDGPDAQHHVYLAMPVKGHGVGTKCLLMAIEKNYFDRKPQATIKIDDQIYTVDSTDLNPGKCSEQFSEDCEKAKQTDDGTCSVCGSVWIIGDDDLDVDSAFFSSQNLDSDNWSARQLEVNQNIE